MMALESLVPESGKGSGKEVFHSTLKYTASALAHKNELLFELFILKAFYFIFLKLKHWVGEASRPAQRGKQLHHLMDRHHA